MRAAGQLGAGRHAAGTADVASTRVAVHSGWSRQQGTGTCIIVWSVHVPDTCRTPLARPAGFVQRRWVWVALFAPLWGTLFINFGIGPVVSRTADLMPLLGNAAGFAAAAAAVGFSPQVARAAGLTTDEDSA